MKRKIILDYLLTTVRFAATSSKVRVVWFALLLFSLLGMADIPGVKFLHFDIWLQWIVVFLVAILKASVLVLLLCLFRGNRLVVSISCVLFCAYCFVCVANTLCYLFYGFGISHKMLMVISQTNMSEASQFLPGLASNVFSVLFSPFFGCAVVCVVLVGWVLVFVPCKLFGRAVCICSSMAVCALVCIFATLDQGKNVFFLSLRIPRYVMDVRYESRQIDELMSKLADYDTDWSAVSSHRAANVIFVIGESASRGHLSMYGYPLPTSPEMEAMADSIFVFADAIGSSVTTVGNMDRILTFKEDDAVEGEWWKHPLLIDVMRKAGYKCFWLSNQELAGVYANASGVMVSRADVVNFISGESGNEALLQKYDEALVPEVEKAMADTSDFVFVGVHLMGSHTEYSKRYPNEWEFFSGEDVERMLPRPWMTDDKYRVVAAYDNSVRYTDHVVGEILKMVAESPEPSLMIYFSDHGEDVYDDRDFIGRDDRYVEVPFMIYLNRAYREANPDIAASVGESLGKRISTANVANTFMTLTGTVFDRYDAKNDFLSPEFVSRRRYVDETLWRYDE